MTARPNLAARARWIAFWLVSAVFYVSYFGRSAASYADVLHLALPLLGVAMLTTWVVGKRLVPATLLQGRTFLFGLYLAYVLVVAAFLVLAIIVGAFVLVARYQTRNMAPAALDRPGLFVGVGIVVAVAVSAQILGHWHALRERQHRLQEEQRATQERLARAEAALREARQGEPGVLEIQVDRSTVRVPLAGILYLESAGDYVLVKTATERFLTKARLTDLARRLAGHGFVRTHRSFVVRAAAVQSWSGQEVVVDGRTVPVGRTYREFVREALGAPQPNSHWTT